MTSKNKLAVAFWRNGRMSKAVGTVEPKGYVDFDGEAYVFTAFTKADDKQAEREMDGAPETGHFGTTICIGEDFALAIYNAVKRRIE